MGDMDASADGIWLTEGACEGWDETDGSKEIEGAVDMVGLKEGESDGT